MLPQIKKIKGSFRQRRTEFIIFLLVCLLVAGASANDKPDPGKKKKLYISTIKAKGISPALANKAKEGIRLAIFESFGNQYHIMDDEAIKVMFKQAESIQASGCSDTSCITQIADGINADEIVYGYISQEGPNIVIGVTSLERKGLNLGTKSIVKVSFLGSQIDHYTSEIAKKLMNSRYIIKRDVQDSFDRKIMLKGIKVENIKDVSLRQMSAYNIGELKFTSNDEAISNILDSLKNGVKIGDDAYQDAKYSTAADEYNSVLGRIRSKLSLEKQEKLKNFASEVTKRMNSAYKMDMKRDIDAGDLDFQNQKYKDARKKYYSLLERIESLPKEVGQNIQDVREETKKRAEATFVVAFKKSIDDIDAKLKANDSPNERFLNETIDKYKEIETNFSDMPKNIAGEGVLSLQDAINNRKDNLTIAIISLYEKNGDLAYSEYRFAEARNCYIRGKELSGKIINEKLNAALSTRFTKKFETTEKTGQSYLENKLKSLTDQAEYFNVDDKTRQAKKVMSEAKDALIGPLQIFSTLKAIDIYNKVAEVLEIEKISRLNEPEVFIPIDKRKEEEKQAAEEKSRIAREKREKVELEEKLADYKKKGITAKEIGRIIFINIPAGIYSMGSPKGKGEENERPLHTVTVSEFWMGMFEVTQKQYKELMGENPSLFQGEDLPVEQVSYNDAVEFCKIFSKKYNVNARLPFEAEWEYACRAGTSSTYYWNFNDKIDYCWYDRNSKERTHPVGTKLPNAWGLHDMSGNVKEWCYDYYDDQYYSISPETNPKGPKQGDMRVVRGGSWDDDKNCIRSAYRNWLVAFRQSGSCGFRVVISPQ